MSTHYKNDFYTVIKHGSLESCFDLTGDKIKWFTIRFGEELRQYELKKNTLKFYVNTRWSLGKHKKTPKYVKFNRQELKKIKILFKLKHDKEL